MFQFCNQKFVLTNSINNIQSMIYNILFLPPIHIIVHDFYFQRVLIRLHIYIYVVKPKNSFPKFPFFPSLFALKIVNETGGEYNNDTV